MPQIIVLIAGPDVIMAELPAAMAHFFGINAVAPGSPEKVRSTRCAPRRFACKIFVLQTNLMDTRATCLTGAEAIRWAKFKGCARASP